MPDLKLTDEERTALVQWVNTQRSAETTGTSDARRKLNMLQPNLIPVLDPNPLPAPYWVFKLLLIVTFFLHIWP